MSKRIFIIAGEASGDLHGANLVKALKSTEPNLELKGWGGDLMKTEGVELLEHYKNLAFMGFTEVLMNIRTIMRNFKRCKTQLLQFNPHAVIFIDYPGFNLRMAKFVKEQGFKSLYYISPQIWAWKQGRVKKIKAYVDEMYTILPFESEFYQRYDYEVNYVGHPLLDVAQKKTDAEEFRAKNKLSSAPILAVLPGSRSQEIDRMLKVMLDAARNFPLHQIVIAGAPGKTANDYAKYLNDKNRPNEIHLLFNQTYELFKLAEAGWVTSGTATLEAAIHNMPEVVVYKAGNISYQIAKRLIKVKFISLVNLVIDREVVKELIQHEANAEQLVSEMNLILKGGAHREQLLEDYALLREKLGNSGASMKAAKHMLKTIAQAE